MRYKGHFCAIFMSLLPLWGILVPFNVYMCYAFHNQGLRAGEAAFLFSCSFSVAMELTSGPFI